jgi:16S rRNA (guanine966-N2)-methyltransferase
MVRRKAKKTPAEMAGVRIIGGRFRGRKLHFSGDPRTRPMKDRLRETVFNLLGDAIRGTQAIDLFAGTGALGLEALSRGAVRATFCEQHFPTVEIIRQNITALGVEAETVVIAGNVFSRFRRVADLGPEPWMVFCSPPYDFYVSRSSEMIELITRLLDAAPAQSVFVVEADARFDFTTLPEAAAWDVRSYPPAVLGVYRKGLGIRD